jgi:hypothetical protein
MEWPWWAQWLWCARHLQDLRPVGMGPTVSSTWDDLRFCWLAPLTCVKCCLERSKPRHEWHQWIDITRLRVAWSRYMSILPPLPFFANYKHVLGEIAMFGGDLPRFRCLNPVISVRLLRLWLPFLTPSEKVFEPLQTNLNHLLKRCFLKSQKPTIPCTNG